MSRAAAVSSPLPKAAATAACAADIIEVLPAVMDAVRDAMRRQVGGGLSVPQFRCLNFVDHRPGASISALAAFMGTSLATASANADRLVRAALIEALPAAADRRRSELRVTPAGAALLEGMRAQARDEIGARLEKMSMAEVQSLHAGLRVLKTGFGHQQ